MEKETKIFLVIFTVFFIFLFATIDDTGVTHDEVVYFSQTMRLANTSLGFFEKFEAFKPPYHGAFMHMFSLPLYLLTRSFLDTTTALRVGSSVLYSLFLVLFFFFLKNKFNGFTALIATTVLMGMPRLFFHSHLLASDLTIAALYFAATILFFEATTKRSMPYTLLTGLVLGAMLATKITGYFIFIALLIYTMCNDIKKKEITTWNVGKAKIPMIIIVFAIGGLFFFIISPQLYKDPLLIIEYLKYHSPQSRWDSVFLFNASHEPSSPISFLFVPTTLIATFNTLQVLVTLYGVAIMFMTRNKRIAYLGFIFLLTTLFFMSPMGYKGDGHGERYFLMLYPFLAVFAGTGAQSIRDAIMGLQKQDKKNKYRAIVDGIIIVLFMGTSAFAIVSSHPFESSYFNSIVGGTKGVAEHNMLTATYWSDELKYTLDWLNKFLPQNATIEAPPQASPYRWYQSQGLLRKDIKISGDSPQYLIVTLRQSSFFPRELWDAASAGLIKPLFVVKNNQGVDLVRIYKMPQYELVPFPAWPFREYEQIIPL